MKRKMYIWLLPLALFLSQHSLAGSKRPDGVKNYPMTGSDFDHSGVKSSMKMLIFLF